MSLLRLPSETLDQIFDQIGPSFFRENLGRLTLSKRWFEFALPAFLRCILLSQGALRNLIRSRTIAKSSPLEDSLETLVLQLGDRQSWTKDLTEDLAQLATIAQHSRRLRSIRVQAWNVVPREALENPELHTPLPPIPDLLSVENLSVLVLDLSGSSGSFPNPPGQQVEQLHICPAISTSLRTLRILHLRLPRICAEAVTPPDPNDNLHLRVMVINLSQIVNLPDVTAVTHSKRCDSQGGGLLSLEDEIQEQAEALVARTACLETVRILTHSFPRLETQSLDVLTGKTMILDGDMAWDEDGKTVKEDSDWDSASELGDDEFATYLDD